MEKLYTKEEIREICLGFFFWWYNQPGTNTYQGFDKYMEEVVPKKFETKTEDK
jgi:hypothetical protein